MSDSLRGPTHRSSDPWAQAPAFVKHRKGIPDVLRLNAALELATEVVPWLAVEVAAVRLGIKMVLGRLSNVVDICIAVMGGNTP